MKNITNVSFTDRRIQNAWNRLYENKYEERHLGPQSLVDSAIQKEKINDLQLVVKALVKEIARGPAL